MYDENDEVIFDTGEDKNEYEEDDDDE